jgi:hypothetical protein
MDLVPEDEDLAGRHQCFELSLGPLFMRPVPSLLDTDVARVRSVAKAASLGGDVGTSHGLGAAVSLTASIRRSTGTAVTTGTISPWA